MKFDAEHAKRLCEMIGNDAILITPEQHPKGQTALLVPIVSLASLMIDMLLKRLKEEGIDPHVDDKFLYGCDMGVVEGEHPTYGIVQGMLISMPEVVTDEDAERLPTKGEA